VLDTTCACSLPGNEGGGWIACSNGRGVTFDGDGLAF
jgi:hypothetical protein